jgi:hypothetical protein
MRDGINTCNCLEGSTLDQKILVLVPLAACFCTKFGSEISCSDPIFHQKERKLLQPHFEGMRG